MNNSVKSVDIENATAFIRHELRTPINAIVGYGEMVQEELDAEDSPLLTKVDILLVEAKKLLETINLFVKYSDGEDASDFQKLFSAITHTTNPSITKIIIACDDLLVAKECTDRVEIIEDIKKIRLAGLRLQGLVNNIESIFTNFLDSLNLNLQSDPSVDTSPESSSDQTEIILSNIRTNRIDRRELLTGNILVVDDNPSNLDLFFQHLTRKGHTVTTSLSAKDALVLLKNQSYDLILLDLLMPETNGDQFLEYLKTSSEFQHIPVIIVSALDEFESIIRCIEIGAEDFLPKPFDPVLLKARIGSSLEKKRLRDQEKLYTQQVEALSEMMAKELEKGRQMQKNFLPARLLTRAGWEFSAYFSPARQLAGDFYDLFELPGDRLGLVVADVCDKGVGAALFMGLFRSLIRIFSGQAALDGLINPSLNLPGDRQDSEIELDDLVNGINFEPLESIKLINNYVAINHGEASMFATIFFGILEPSTGKLSYINGGHEPVFIVDSNHQLKSKLTSTGPAVGMLPDLDFKVGEIILQPGDLLLSYTDGVTEAKSPTGKFFGKEKLLEALGNNFNSVEQLMGDLKTSLAEHMGEAEQFDDITLLAVKFQAN
ncbi:MULTISPECIES: SpoIIE family protein phosphatase [unclassified Synechocystis]|uniref:SpoIIE family protein phosphatase n=1 Tax=unclassified Synechocystis TaxID=2640012 RepID=UPI0003F56A81|nr:MULTISPECIES: SpoIIE family protein phosphatase [unclassified Synechocystis]AIE72650.1 Serine phosphatase RsbU, regulator of sigma subunit [Synechocystis sp. PCC 6714]MCT0254685.1 SpoIIE family protein phosphatase [Synechocystis sp. CS-94]